MILLPRLGWSSGLAKKQLNVGSLGAVSSISVCIDIVMFYGLFMDHI